MKLIIIDGNSLINRAYYALQKPMITKSGLYTHGVYGFLNILNRIKIDYEPDYLAVAFDRKAPTFRHEEYAEYKAGRKKMPQELAMQMPILKEVLAAMNIKSLEIDGFEADDIIGTVVKKAEAEGLNPLIISGDKDELQLATKKTKILITKKGISEFELYDEDAMIEKYGFTPVQFIDYKGLMGDQSDNIPGIPGVGEKTAQKLIHEFGSVNELINRTDEISSKTLKAKIEEHAQLALMSKRLATINTEVPIDINFEEFKFVEPDYDKLIELYIKLEFNSFLKKMQATNINKSSSKKNDFEQNSSSINNMPDSPIGYSGEAGKKHNIKERSVKNKIIVDSLDKFMLMEKDIKDTKDIILKVFNDNNHKAIPYIYGISLLSDETNYFIKPECNDIIAKFCDILVKDQISINGHDLKSDYYALISNGYLNQEGSYDNGRFFNTGFDTALAKYILDPSKSEYGIKTLVLEYFHEDIMSEKEFIEQNGQIGFLSQEDLKFSEYGNSLCIATDKLIKVLTEKLTEEDLDEVYYEVELPLVEVLASMESCGFSVDKNELTMAGKIIGENIKLLTEKIYALAGEEFNINSPLQLGNVLFDKMGLPSGKKTKRGYATGIEVLEKLREEYEIVEDILTYRMYSKLKSTYIDGLIPLIHEDGKIHAHFQQTVTTTGRISCTEPNLQNIPIRQELGRKLRKAFVTENEDYVLVGADYSQIELRILAHLSNDPLLIEAFSIGEDIHKTTASKVFEVPLSEVTPLQRSNAKAVNFGVIYGMSGFGLSTELNITRKEAEKYINDYFKKYTKVKEYLDGLVSDCKKNGYVTTIMKRKRAINEINASNFMVRQAGERLAMNTPIQGSAADIIKLAMIKVYRELAKEKTKSRLILQVHDELIIQTHKSELEKVKKLLEDCMSNAISLKVSLSTELSTGSNWYELK